MHRNFEYTKLDIVATEADIAVIDPGKRREEIEKQIGKNKADVLYSILAYMLQKGDVPTVSREIFHNAYFKSMREAVKFGEWSTARGYKVFATWQVRKSSIRVEFSHVGQTTLDSLVEHEKFISALAIAHGGYYDGWETSAEREQANSIEMERQFHRRHPWHRGNIPDIPESKFAFILQMKNDVLTEFRSRVKALEFRDLKFTTITNLRHHVHLKSAENDAPIKFVFRIAISGKSASAEKLNRVQQLFDEIISQECFQSCRDIIVHIK